MGTTVDPPNDNPGEGEPGDPGYTPPTGPNTKIALVVTSSNLTLTEDQIVAAGGPWAAFTIKVTPVNDNGTGAPGEFDYPPP
jgi:hypothetical protein